MNLSESLKSLAVKIDSLSQLLKEDKGHLDHPEDLVFLGGIDGANRAINSIEQTTKNPKTVTIKWDGYPALIFGRGSDNKFSIMDKHMFNKKDGSGRQVFSPEQFRKYDLDRGVDRSGLHQILAKIWPGLEQEDRGGTGYYWGDLLFSDPLKEQNGLYKFKANPNGITYTVDADSDVGKLIEGKVAGIAVHQFIPPEAPSTDYAKSLDGTIGNLRNSSNVAIVPSAMPTRFNLKLDTDLVKNAQNSISKYGQAVSKLMATPPMAQSTFQQLFTTYINKRIVAGNLNDLLDGFIEYYQIRPMTDKMVQKLSEYFQENEQGLVGLFTIWVDIYKLKMSIVEQLNKAAEASPVQGYLQDGTKTQEGFVANGLKFVDRMGFSRQNLAGR